MTAEYRVRVDDADELARELLAALAARGDVRRLDEAPSGRVLVLGGARSGKSSWAERQLRDREACYLATSEADPSDAEWMERVRLHRERRPAHWTTVETLDVASHLGHDGPPLLVDCLAVWLTRNLDDVGAWEDRDGWRAALTQRTARLVEAVADSPREAFLVSNEVGSGVVPGTRAGRLFRDELGRLNAGVASACDQVWLVVAGIPRRLK